MSARLGVLMPGARRPLRRGARRWPMHGTRRATVAAAAVLLFTALPLGAQQQQSQQSQQQQAKPGEKDRFLKECSEGAKEQEKGGESRLSDKCLPLAEIAQRPHALIELGEPFLGTGTLHKGIKLPGGAVWQPAFLAFGTLRTAAQGGHTNPGSTDLAEAAGRFDLFGNLYLTQTERVLVGLRPLDRDGRFTSYTFTNPPLNAKGEKESFHSELNGVVRTLFFEGDFGELFPNIDNDDSGSWDIYFSVGRQPLDFQDGLLVNENALDMVGLTRANMKLGSVVNTRITAVYSWGQIDRQSAQGNIRDDSASLFGLFSEMDLRSTTLQLDAAFVNGSTSSGDGIYAGIGDIRRWGRANNVFRVLGSFPIGGETAFNTRGVLLHDQFSWTSRHSDNFWYFDTFVGIDRFRSAARGPSSGGPLGQTGILFAAPGIGRVGAGLSNQADNALGGSFGHQIFLHDTRQQLVFEVGGRARMKKLNSGSNLAGLGARYQAAFHRRVLFVVDGSTAWDFVSNGMRVFGRFDLTLNL